MTAWTSTAPPCLPGLPGVESGHEWRKVGTFDQCAICSARRRPPRRGDPGPFYRAGSRDWNYLGRVSDALLDLAALGYGYTPGRGWGRLYVLRSADGHLAEVRLAIQTARPRRR